MTESDDRPSAGDASAAERTGTAFDDDQMTSQFGQTSLLAGVGTTEPEEQRQPASWHAGADIGLLVLRVVVGATIGAHGMQKLFGLFGGPGIEGFAKSLASMGFSHTTVLAYVTGWSELVGGVLLVLGLLTPLGAAAVLGVLGNALYMKSGSGFFSQTGGFEYDLVLGVTAFTLAFTGPGRVAMDYGRAWHRKPTAWGILGVLLAIIATVLVFVFGRQ